jgi:hypothetical protein
MDSILSGTFVSEEKTRGSGIIEGSCLARNLISITFRYQNGNSFADTVSHSSSHRTRDAPNNPSVPSNAMWGGGWDNLSEQLSDVIVLQFAPPTDLLKNDFVDIPQQPLTGTYWLKGSAQDKGSFVMTHETRWLFQQREKPSP